MTSMSINPAALRTIRQRTGLSIRQLADAAGLSFSQVAAIERGDSKPSPSTMVKLAEALAVPITAIVAEVPA